MPRTTMPVWTGAGRIEGVDDHSVHVRTNQQRRPEGSRVE